MNADRSDEGGYAPWARRVPGASHDRSKWLRLEIFVFRSLVPSTTISGWRVQTHPDTTAAVSHRRAEEPAGAPPRSGGGGGRPPVRQENAPGARCPCGG